MFEGLLDTTRLDISIMAAMAGYTALRLSMHIERGYLPAPAFFRRRTLLTGYAYLGIFFLSAALIITLIVNPWWAALAVLFFAAIVGEFVVISLMREFSYIFSLVTMAASTYLYLRHIA